MESRVWVIFINFAYQRFMRHGLVSGNAIINWIKSVTGHVYGGYTCLLIQN